MRIGIDASVAGARGTGTARYATRLVGNLVARDRDNAYILYFRRGDVGTNPLWGLTAANITRRLTDAPLGLLRVHANMPVHLRRDGIEMYHSLGFFLPWGWRGPSVVMIHDIHPILQRTRWNRPGNRVSYLALRLHIPLALRQARWILAPSVYVRDTIARRFPRVAAKIVVTPHGSDPFFTRPLADAEELARARRHTGADRYFLYVGVLCPHKNVAGLIRAFARLKRRRPADPVRLVLAGLREHRHWESELAPLIRVLGLSEAVVSTGYVDDSILRGLYRGAVALALPSFAEGFGLPLLEAMGCGTPVITSSVSALPEVAGDAALYADPSREDDIAGAMERLLDDGALRRTLVSRGHTQLATFDWVSTVDRVLACYRS
jgi:alpha-1,3-rhamnosyl/mannosyltransferase